MCSKLGGPHLLQPLWSSLAKQRRAALRVTASGVSGQRHQNVLESVVLSVLHRVQKGVLLHMHGGLKFRTAFDHVVRRVRLLALSPSFSRSELQLTSCNSVSLDQTDVRGRWACIRTAHLQLMKLMPRWQSSTLQALASKASSVQSGFPNSGEWSEASSCCDPR